MGGVDGVGVVPHCYLLFHRASLKLGLDKAVLQSMNTQSTTGVSSIPVLSDLLHCVDTSTVKFEFITFTHAHTHNTAYMHAHTHMCTHIHTHVHTHTRTHTSLPN